MKANTDDAPARTEVTYRVTVTKIVRNFPFRNKEYEKIGEVADPEARDGVKPEYGYVYFDDSKDVETPVYKQEVEEVDLPAVIKAVNGMEG